MQGYIELEKPSHCIECYLRNDDDNCVIQRDGNNEFIEYDTWEQQITMCPIQENLKVHKVLKEIFDLLEEHQPPWYLRKHYNLIREVLGQ